MPETAILLQASIGGITGAIRAQGRAEGRQGGQEGYQGGQEGHSALLFWPSWNTAQYINQNSDGLYEGRDCNGKELTQLSFLLHLTIQGFFAPILIYQSTGATREGRYVGLATSHLRTHFSRKVLLLLLPVTSLALIRAIYYWRGPNYQKEFAVYRLFCNQNQEKHRKKYQKIQG